MLTRSPEPQKVVASPSPPHFLVYVGVGDSGVGCDVCIYGLSRRPALIHVFDYIFSTDRKSSVSGPAGSIQGEYAHELVELTTLHYWGSEGTGVERPRFG